MADWKDKFREGSFRGVPFKTDSAQTSGGRRKQDREYAKRDTGNSEDLGKKLKSFTLELLVIGDDYFAQRDALEAALDTEGAGELVHPYRGTFQAQVGAYTISEVVGEARLARFSVEFSEAGQVKFPDQSTDDLGNTSDNAENLIDKSKTFFETIFSIANQPAFVVDSAAGVVTSVMDFAESTVAKVTNPVTDFSFAVRNIKNSVNDLIKTPDILAQRLQDAFDLLLGGFSDDPETSNKIFGNIREVGDTFLPVPGTTPSRLVQQGNQDAFVNLTTEMVLGMQTLAAVDIDFVSVSESLLVRDDIVKGLNQELLNADDDDLFQAIKDLQTSLIKALPTTGLTELITFTPPKTLPALVIAHSLFEDLGKEDEIVEQNDIQHPGFVPGGDEIEVSAS